MPTHLPVQDAQLKRALVAEDSVLHQRLAIGLLSRRGFEVTVVSNGREAVAAARQGSFDVIFMDVEMPILNGCDATRQIRDEETSCGKHVPIVAVTSLDERDLVLSAGMDAYLHKPLSAAALDSVLPDFVA